MKYLVERITLIREKEGAERKSFSFDSDDVTTNLSEYKARQKRKFNATMIHLNYSEIPQEDASTNKNTTR